MEFSEARVGFCCPVWSSKSFYARKSTRQPLFYSYWKRESRHFGNGILWRSTFGGLILVWNPDKWKTITGILPTNVRSYTRSTSSRSDDSLSRPGLIPLLAVKSIYFLINLTCGFLFFYQIKMWTLDLFSAFRQISQMWKPNTIQIKGLFNCLSAE